MKHTFFEPRYKPESQERPFSVALPRDLGAFSTKAAAVTNGHRRNKVVREYDRDLGAAARLFLWGSASYVTAYVSMAVGVLPENAFGVAALLGATFLPGVITLAGKTRTVSAPEQFESQFATAYQHVRDLGQLDRSAGEMALHNLRVLTEAARDALIADGDRYSQLVDQLRRSERDRPWGRSFRDDDWFARHDARAAQMQEELKQTTVQQVRDAVSAVGTAARERAAAIRDEQSLLEAPHRELVDQVRREREAHQAREAELARYTAAQQVSNLLEFNKKSLADFSVTTEDKRNVVALCRETA